MDVDIFCIYGILGYHFGHVHGSCEFLSIGVGDEQIQHEGSLRRLFDLVDLFEAVVFYV